MQCESQSRTCVPSLPPGQPCTHGACIAGSHCEPADAGAVCAPDPRLGGSCGVVLRGADIVEGETCGDGYCDRLPGALSGTCQPFKDIGQPCTFDKECDQGARRTCRQGRCTMDACGESW